MEHREDAWNVNGSWADVETELGREQIKFGSECNISELETLAGRQRTRPEVQIII